MSAPAPINTVNATDATGTATQVVLPSLPTGSGGVLILYVSHGNVTSALAGEVQIGESMALPLADTWYRVRTAAGGGSARATCWVARGNPPVPTVTFSGTTRTSAALTRVGPTLPGSRPFGPMTYRDAIDAILPGVYPGSDTLVMEFAAMLNGSVTHTLDAKLTEVARVFTGTAVNSMGVLAGTLTPAAPGVPTGDFTGTNGSATNWTATALVIRGDTASPVWPNVPPRRPAFDPNRARVLVRSGGRWRPTTPA